MLFLKQIASGLQDALVSVLPLSPFSAAIENFASLPYMGYINWVIPVGLCADVLAAWLISIAIFYIYMAVLRWAKMIE